MRLDRTRTELGAGEKVTPESVLDRDRKFLEEMHRLCMEYKDSDPLLYEEALDQALVALDRVNSSLLL